MHGAAPDPPQVVRIDLPYSFEREIVREPMTILASGRFAAIESFEDAVLLAPVTLGPGVSLRECRFRGAVGLEHLEFQARRDTLRRKGRRYAIAEDGFRGDHAEVEQSYRQLRRSMLASRQFDAAASFHIGELEARRRAARPYRLTYWWLLVYRFLGGYGHRPSRPLLSYVAMVLSAAWWLYDEADRFDGGDIIIGEDLILPTHYTAVLFRVVIRTSIAILSPLDVARMHTDGFVLLLATRVMTIVFLVWGAMGVHSRLRR